MLKKISTAVAAMLLVLGAAAPVTADTSSAMEGFLVRVHAVLGLGGPSVSDVEAAVLAWEACEASPGSLVMDLLEGSFLVEHGDLNNGDFIAAVYQHALQRSPGTAGAAYWEDLLDRGTPRSAVVLSFSQSAEVIAATETGTSGALGAPCEPELDPGTINPPDPGPGGGSMIELPKPPAPSEPVSELRRSYREALAWMSSNAVDETPEGVIHRLYHAVFARPADAEGLKYWESLYRQGVSPVHITSLLLASDEASYSHTGLAPDQFVEMLYRRVLGRTPDNGGFTYWTLLLRTGKLDRARFVVLLAHSQEFIGSIRAAHQP